MDRLSKFSFPCPCLMLNQRAKLCRVRHARVLVQVTRDCAIGIAKGLARSEPLE